MRKLAIGITFLSLTSAAQKPNLPAEVQLHSLPINQIQRSILNAPETMGYSDTLSLSEATIGFEHHKITKPIFPQFGTGKSEFKIVANSFLHLDNSQTIWGDIEFSTGKHNDIKWCNVLDYHIVGPYVLGDEVGGNMSFRRYVFGGGYNYKISPRWNVGTEIGYRAEIGWREHDPRIKTIVSDLDLSFGASCLYTTNRLVGLHASVRSYTQNCDLEFYNPMNDINTLPLTGLGTYNKRFAGNTNKNSGHCGLGYGLGAEWTTIDGNGFQLKLEFEELKISEHLRNFNNITLAYTNTYQTKASLSYGISFTEKIKLMPLITAQYSHRIGTENLFGTAEGASYDIIGSYKPYKNENINATLKMPLEMKIDAGYISVIPSLELHSFCEELNTLQRKMEIFSLLPNIGLNFSRLSGNWNWRLSCDYMYYKNLSNSCSFPDFDSSSALQSSVMSTFNMLSSNMQAVESELNLSRAVHNIVAGIAISYQYCSYLINAKSHHLNISLNLSF